MSSNVATRQSPATTGGSLTIISGHVNRYRETNTIFEIFGTAMQGKGKDTSHRSKGKTLKPLA